jgi:hypothetical protein
LGPGGCFPQLDNTVRTERYNVIMAVDGSPVDAWLRYNPSSYQLAGHDVVFHIDVYRVLLSAY